MNVLSAALELITGWAASFTIHVTKNNYEKYI